MPDSTKSFDANKSDANKVNTVNNPPNVTKTGPTIASTTNPVGSATLDESKEASEEIKSTKGSKLQRIERILHDGGMDSMSVLKAVQAIGSILNEDEPDPKKSDKSKVDTKK